MPKKSERGPREPNLELPSLGLGLRRRRRSRESVAPPPTGPEPRPEPEPRSEPEPRPEPPHEPDPRPEPEPPHEPEPRSEDTRPLAPAVREEHLIETVRRERRPSPLTRIPAGYAAAGAGIVCGLAGVVLTSLALHACESVRGVGSCGGIGLLALLLILVLEIFIGGALLRACAVPDSFSTSFLGVGLVAVAILLFLLGNLDSPWMLLVIPLVTAATFVLSWLVTRTFVEVD